MAAGEDLISLSPISIFASIHRVAGKRAVVVGSRVPWPVVEYTRTEKDLRSWIQCVLLRPLAVATRDVRADWKGSVGCLRTSRPGVHQHTLSALQARTTGPSTVEDSRSRLLDPVSWWCPRDQLNSNRQSPAELERHGADHAVERRREPAPDPDLSPPNSRDCLACPAAGRTVLCAAGLVNHISLYQSDRP